MSVGGRNAPLSPVSIGASEWSSTSVRIHSKGGHYPHGHGNLVSPPNSGGSNGTMNMNGFPSGPRSNGGPSPPASMYSARSEGNRASTRGDIDESVMNEHYVTLKAFLHTRDSSNRQQPNKARDKLLRLSTVQFYELSTDVFDELMRRQATARAPPNALNALPTYLLPEKSFHPKRNQARQRLSSLGPPRFRDLASDVFHELERRFPYFVAADISRDGSAMSGPMSRTGTPANGNMFPPRGQSRIRRPSDSSSTRGLLPGDGYGIPASSTFAGGDHGRPMPKQLNHSNTIVPNKSTMVEDDDDDDDDDVAFELDGIALDRDGGRMQGGGATSEADKKLIEDYQAQLKNLRGKLDGMEDHMKRKEDEMNGMLDMERARATAAILEKKEWGNTRLKLEKKLAEAQTLNRSMKEELSRVRDEHLQEARRLRDEISELNRAPKGGVPDPELQKENDELRDSLRRQQQVTEEVRREGQAFLTEMRQLSEQSGSTYEKQAEMERTIEQLERDVRDWRNRYARAKTQLRSIRSSSLGLTMDQDVAKCVRDKGFLEESGLVEDVHVTKFQMAIDELLRVARTESPDKVTEAMKMVVVSVRRITSDLDDAAPRHEEQVQQQTKLKARVSSTANALITASKNFAAGAGISPIALLDAAASHLCAAIVDLLQLAKIRTTSGGELWDDDEVTTPVESAGAMSSRRTTQTPTQPALPPPPPFQGLGGIRASAESSAYSPISSPRESVDPYPTNGSAGLANGRGYLSLDGEMLHKDSRAEDLKIYLDDQTAMLVSGVQRLVSCVRAGAAMRTIMNEVESIRATVDKVVAETSGNGYGQLVTRLDDGKKKILEACERGQDLANLGQGPGDGDWRRWAQTLPPIAFGIVRETKELAQRVDSMAAGGADEFS
ncbi:hypothetical protein RJ55_08431 [Drechmeria coniospora]|nr:hypothetical protein RJ55_08431 [Drechmeria coniospora]